MQEELLEGHPGEPLRVYAVWANFLPSDSRGGWKSDLLVDPRVTELWDSTGELGSWIFDHQADIGFEFFGGAKVWDASLLFGPDATWDSAPQPLEHFGYTIIRDRKGLEQNLERLWDALPQRVS